LRPDVKARGHLAQEFVAYFGYEKENVETVEEKKCGLCRGDEYRRDSFKGATIRLMAQVTSRQ